MWEFFLNCCRILLENYVIKISKLRPCFSELPQNFTWKLFEKSIRTLSKFFRTDAEFYLNIVWEKYPNFVQNSPNWRRILLEYCLRKVSEICPKFSEQTQNLLKKNLKKISFKYKNKLRKNRTHNRRFAQWLGLVFFLRKYANY